MTKDRNQESGNKKESVVTTLHPEKRSPKPEERYPPLALFPFLLHRSEFSLHFSSVILLIFVATPPSSVSAMNRAM